MKRRSRVISVSTATGKGDPKAPPAGLVSIHPTLGLYSDTKASAAARTSCFMLSLPSI